ncbi:WAT1-related protein At5g40240-like isoform X2 [Lotus japonicus]|uniref:WAT1-related protein At5g40240-like isoform X2 n=1 Tax=Lotus japonicus TaxID=34305 RepID=UPI00258AB6D2|nr:WAT1-related protein At5g40240-like isoform X2 [Lotus japonicus]
MFSLSTQTFWLSVSFYHPPSSTTGRELLHQFQAQFSAEYFFFLASVQILLYTGIGYSSPTLASAMVDLVPAFTFTLAVIFRMENLNLKLHSSQAKIVGTVVSIAGALILTLYQGMPLIRGSMQNLVLGGSGTYLSVQSNWILGGFLLATAGFCVSVLFIVQTWIIREYPEELVVTTVCCSMVVVLSAIVALIAEGTSKAWVLRLDKELAAVCYSAIFVVSLRSVVSAWACRKKGPIYVAMFSPLGMVIAVVLGVLLLGDSLYVGSLIGAITIAVGFYGVMWAQAQEENVVNIEKIKDFASSSSAPLMSTKAIDV